MAENPGFEPEVQVLPVQRIKNASPSWLAAKMRAICGLKELARAQIGGRNTLQFTGFAASPMAHWMLPETHSRGALGAPLTKTPGRLSLVSARVSRSMETGWRKSQLLKFLAHLGWTSSESSGETAGTQGRRRASSPSSFGSSPGGSRASLKVDSTPRGDVSCEGRSGQRGLSREWLGAGKRDDR